MMYALMLPVLMFGAGFAIDYTHAMQVQTKLDAAADAAVLAALTPSMMQQSNATAQTAATNMFNAEAERPILARRRRDQRHRHRGSRPPAARSSATSRSAYTAANQNIFAGILGYSALGIYWLLDRDRVGRGQHRLLSAARQFAVDGAAGDRSRASPRWRT